MFDRFFTRTGQICTHWQLQPRFAKRLYAAQPADMARYTIYVTVCHYASNAVVAVVKRAVARTPAASPTSITALRRPAVTRSHTDVVDPDPAETIISTICPSCEQVVPLGTST